MSPRRIRTIRRALGYSRRDFARTLWAASKTVMEWENGKRSPMGVHQRLLALWEQGLADSRLQSALQDRRASDPMYLLFRLLRPLYRKRGGNRNCARPKRSVPRRSKSANILPATASLAPGQIRDLRKTLGFSQGEFAHFLWITYSTLNRWEHGLAPPFGMHLRILTLLERHSTTPSFQAILRSPRRADHLFLLHQLLHSTYASQHSRV